MSVSHFFTPSPRSPAAASDDEPVQGHGDGAGSGLGSGSGNGLGNGLGQCAGAGGNSGGSAGDPSPLVNPQKRPSRSPPPIALRHMKKRAEQPCAAAAGDRQCWLCVYATHSITHTINTLICEHMHSMSVDTIAQQCSDVIRDEIRRTQPCNADDVQGFSAKDVRRHILDHMLHPNVTFATTLRSLLDINKQLRQNVFVRDPEAEGVKVLDQSTLKNYLAVTAQIASIYKLGETGKLLFSRGGGAAGSEQGAGGSAGGSGGSGAGGGGGARK